MFKKNKIPKGATVVNLNNDYVTDDFVSLDDNDKKAAKVGNAAAGVVVLMILGAIVAALVVFVINFRLVLVAPVEGSFAELGNQVSVMSKQYYLEPGNLNVGDHVLYYDYENNGQNDLVVHNFQTGVVQEISGNVVNIMNDNGDHKSVERVPTMFIRYRLA